MPAANNNIEKLIKVFDATATRYLSELEEEGEVCEVSIKVIQRLRGLSH